MKKTMTLAKAYGILARTEITEADEKAISEEIKNLPIPALHVYEQYMKAGETRIHAYCHKCKRHMDILGSFLTVPCNCGNANRISVHGEYSNGTKVHVLRVDEDERYFVFSVLDDQLYLDMPSNIRSNNTFDWLESPIRHKSYNREIGMFLEGKGFLFVDFCELLGDKIPELLIENSRGGFRLCLFPALADLQNDCHPFLL